MPATVLEALQDDGTYPDLYYGKNLLDEVPQDLYKQDWWYRTTFTAPAGSHHLPARAARHQLPRRGLAERPPGRGQHTDRRHVQRPRARRGALDPARRAEHPRHQGHAGAGASGHQRGRARRQLVGLDQLELSGIPGSGQEPRPRQFICLRPECGHLEAGVSEGRRRGLAWPRRRQHRITLAANRFRAADRSTPPCTTTRPSRSGAYCKGDDQPRGQADIDVEQPVTLLPGEQREVSFSPDRVRPADGGQSRPVVALHPRQAEPLRPAVGVQSVRPGVGSSRPPVRHPHRLPAPRRRRRLPRSGQGRQLLSDGQRQGLPGPRRGLHARPAVRLRPGPRRRDPAVRQGSRAQHAAAGGQVPRRAHRREGRRARHPADVRLDVLQPVGEVVAVGRRGPPRRRRTACGRRS